VVEWQTRRSQKPLEITLRGGSTPPLGTDIKHFIFLYTLPQYLRYINMGYIISDMQVGRESFVGFQESMHTPDMGFSISAGTGGAEGKIRGSSISTLLSSTEDALRNARTPIEKEAARAKKQSAVRLVLETSAEYLPPDVKRYVVGPRSSDGKLLLSDPQYSQYQIVITFFNKDGRQYALDATRDTLIRPTVMTLAQRDTDRAEVDQLVIANAEVIKEEPIDTYIRNTAELEAIRHRERLVRAEQQASSGVPGVIAYYDRLMIPLVGALTRANKVEFIPEPEIMRKENAQTDDINIQFGLRTGYAIGWVPWLHSQRPREFTFSKELTYTRFPLKSLQAMAAAYNTGDENPVNKAGNKVLQMVRDAGIDITS
jgi:hypothetical protein